MTVRCQHGRMSGEHVSHLETVLGRGIGGTLFPRSLIKTNFSSKKGSVGKMKRKEMVSHSTSESNSSILNKNVFDNNSFPIRERFSVDGFESFLLALQDKICAEVAEADRSGKSFVFDRWERGNDPSAGFGVTRVLEEGDLLEKGAANVSIIRGSLSETRAQALSSRGKSLKAGSPYFAGALSLVFHPRNPFVPTFRADIRYFQVEGGVGWFGGGADLTPCYLFEEDASQFHKFWKEICDKYDSNLYLKSKQICDKYFYIPSRKEHRGIGGIFFDDISQFPQREIGSFELNNNNSSLLSQDRGRGKEEGEEMDRVFDFVKDVGRGFLESYLPIAARRRKIEFGEREREWQLLRRGRYLEFNLLYDRGVRFGLDGGRVESIMVSAPPLIAWKYDFQTDPRSKEEALVEVLRNPRDWV